MVRPSTKKELLQATAAKYGELCLFIESLTEKELTIVFDFSADGKKKGAHWQRGKNLRDILINWVSANGVCQSRRKKENFSARSL